MALLPELFLLPDEVMQVLTQLDLQADTELMTYLRTNKVDTIHLLNFTVSNYGNGLAMRLQFNLCLVRDFLQGVISNPSLDGLPAAFTPQFKACNMITIPNIVYKEKFYNTPKQFIGGLVQQKVLPVDVALCFAVLHNRFSKAEMEAALYHATVEIAEEAGELSTGDALKFIREQVSELFEANGTFQLHLRFANRKEVIELTKKLEALEKKGGSPQYTKRKWEYPTPAKEVAKKPKFEKPVCFQHVSGGCTREGCSWTHSSFEEMNDSLKRVFLKYMHKNELSLNEEMLKFETGDKEKVDSA